MALLKEYDFANGFATVRQLQAAGQTPSGSAAPNGISDRIAVEKAPDGRSSFVARLSSSDPETSLGLRSELAFDLEPLSERWYVWGTYLPNNHPTNLFSIFQIHDVPDDGDNLRYPNFLVITENNWLRIDVPKRVLPTETTDSVIVGTYRLPLGRWFRQCLHVKWATDSTGFLEYMIDGVVLYREWLTANQYIDVLGPHAKIGLYDLFHSGTFPDATAYFDRLRVYGPGESYVSVLGAPPAPRKINQV